ncbi:MAG: hypothetical protein IPM54_37475 [Polyangiaceae bacterium]|nr:hypothetical protein [Polyangiaceae bacterium]
MPSRTGLLFRIFVLFLLALVVAAPMGCIGCGSDRDAAEVKDQLAVHFPKERNEAFYTDDPFVPVGTDGYAASSVEMSSSDGIEPVEITLPVEPDDGVRFASRDGFVVVMRSLDGLERAVLSDGVITYDHEGGGQVWTAKEGGFDVSLFLKPGFVEQEGFTWRWELVGARARPDGDDVVVMDDRGASRLRVTLVKNGSSEHIDTRLRLTGKELALDVPKGPSAVLLQMRVKAVEPSEGDDATVPKQNAVNGTACTLGSECDSTFCIDGVCCDNACTGTCSACTATLKGQGVDGVCGPIKANTDPQNECPAGACYGNGSCRRDNGQPCASGSECMSSVCADNVCCDLACTGICMACTTTLKGQGADGSCGPIMNGLDPNNECTGGSCDGMAACRLDNGETCTTGGQCVSGNCVDGVCCDTTCTNTCKACNLPGKLGTCSNVPQNQNDPVTCAAASESCDGNGFCKLANGENCTQGLECISGFCVDGVCCNSACTTVCSSCAVTGNVGSCSPIALGNDDFFPPNACVGADRQCNGAGACKRFNGTQCASGTDCVSNFCVDGVCCSTSTCANCQSCNVSGNEGTCRNLAMNDTDPNAVPACTGTTACDGSGACKKINGVACTNGDGTQCISGFCVDGGLLQFGV